MWTLLIDQLAPIYFTFRKTFFTKFQASYLRFIFNSGILVQLHSKKNCLWTCWLVQQMYGVIEQCYVITWRFFAAFNKFYFRNIILSSRATEIKFRRIQKKIERVPADDSNLWISLPCFRQMLDWQMSLTYRFCWCDKTFIWLWRRSSLTLLSYLCSIYTNGCLKSCEHFFIPIL